MRLWHKDYDGRAGESTFSPSKKTEAQLQFNEKEIKVTYEGLGAYRYEAKTGRIIDFFLPNDDYLFVLIVESSSESKAVTKVERWHIETNVADLVTAEHAFVGEYLFVSSDATLYAIAGRSLEQLDDDADYCPPNEVPERGYIWVWRIGDDIPLALEHFNGRLWDMSLTKDKKRIQYNYTARIRRFWFLTREKHRIGRILLPRI